jgi:hypothetical protein
MPAQTALIRNLDAREDQLASLEERMEIETLSNSNGHRL